jgi:hypothetical protein
MSEADAIREFHEMAKAEAALKKLAEGTGYRIETQRASAPGKQPAPDDPIEYAVYDESAEPDESNYYGMIGFGFASAEDAIAFIRQELGTKIQ